jgi:hypothetical protein
VVAIIDPLSGVVSMVDTVLDRLDARKAARKASLSERVEIRHALLDLLHLLRLWTATAEKTTLVLAHWVEGGKPNFAIPSVESQLISNVGGGMYFIRQERSRWWRFGRIVSLPVRAVAGLFIIIPSRAVGFLRGRYRHTAARRQAVRRASDSTRSRAFELSEEMQRISDLLFIYAPEFETAFRQTVVERLQLLEELLAELNAAQSSYGRDWRWLLRRFPRRGPLRQAVPAVFPGRELTTKEEVKVDLPAFERSSESLRDATNRLAHFIEANFSLADF